MRIFPAVLTTGYDLCRKLGLPTPPAVKADDDDWNRRVCSGSAESGDTILDLVASCLKEPPLGGPTAKVDRAKQSKLDTALVHLARFELSQTFCLVFYRLFYYNVPCVCAAIL